MYKKADQLRDEAAAAFRNAKSIADRAEAEGRDFTAAELAEAQKSIEDGKRLRAEFEKAVATETMHGALNALGNGGSASADPGSPFSSKSGDLPPKVKAGGGSDWSAKAIQRLSGPTGFKGVIETGAVLVTVPLDPEPVRMDIPVLSLRQLIPSVQNTADYFSYQRQTVRDNNAAVVARGALKPTSIYTVGKVEDRCATIAHLSEPIAKQDLADVPLLQQFIEQEMRLGLELALENEIMNGDNTGDRFTGLANLSGTQSQAFSSNVLTTARKAITKLDRYGSLGRAGWLMSPEDWETIELLADNEGQFYYGGPQAAVNPGSRRLWGAPVVVSDAAATGTAYLADFSTLRLQVREEGKLSWSENVYRPDALGEGVGASDFERNLITFRFEGRFGLEARRPSAIVEVDLTA